MGSNNLMSEQSKRRPLGVTLLGYLFLLTAVGQIHLLVTNGLKLETFLGFLAPPPMPQIEVGLKVVLFVVLGVGLLRMDKWARILLITSLYLSLATTIVGAVIGWINRVQEQQIDSMFPGVVDSQASMQWLIQLILAGGVLLLLLVYAYRLKGTFQHFRPYDESDISIDEHTLNGPEEEGGV